MPLAPERELKPKIDEYRKVSARNKSIAVMLFILGGLFITCLPAFSAIFGFGDEAKFGIVGFAALIICVAIGTGILIYTKNSVPQDVEPFISKGTASNLKGSQNEPQGKFWDSFWKLYWLVITIIYLAISFATGAWRITWLIWLIATAVKQAILMFTNASNNDGE